MKKKAIKEIALLVQAARYIDVIRFQLISVTSKYNQCFYKNDTDLIFSIINSANTLQERLIRCTNKKKEKRNAGENNRSREMV